VRGYISWTQTIKKNLCYRTIRSRAAHLTGEGKIFKVMRILPVGTTD
jgi:hypothetical protein